MAEQTRLSALRSPTAVVAVGLMVLGVALWMLVSKRFLFLAGLGAFGPGILREVGLLKDHDEFRRAAAHRAGYHAYLIGGVAAVVMVSVFEWKGAPGEAANEWVGMILLMLWLSWLFSSVLSYWGERKTASRLLVVCGSCWTLFIVASGIGGFDPNGDLVQGLLGTLVGLGIIAAFFVPAWAVRRWPRPTGFLLLALSVVFCIVFGRNPNGNMPWTTVLLTDLILIAPFLASGMALMKEPWRTTAPVAQSAGLPAAPQPTPQ